MADVNIEQSEWLIIFLIYNNDYYDKKSETSKKNDLSSMEKQTKYILCQIEEAEYHEKVKVIIAEAKIRNFNNTSSITLSVCEKVNKQIVGVEKPVIESAGITFLTEYDNFKQILTSIKLMYPAKRNMVVTAGHGSIVGINYFIPDTEVKANDQPLPPKVELVRERINYKFWESPVLELKEIKNRSKSDFELLFQTKGIFAHFAMKNGKTLQILTNQEIGEAFSDVFGKGDAKLDVLVMYNCLMQNIFAQFEFRETVKWVVAPLSGIAIPGFNYTNILSILANNPALNGKQIAEQFVHRDSIKGINNISAFEKDIEGSWKISASQMNDTLYDSLQEKFHELFKEIRILSDSNIKVINCINETLRFIFNQAFYCLPSIHVVDLGVFLKYFKNKIETEYSKSLKSLIPFISNLYDAVEKVKPQPNHLFQGNGFYNNGIKHKEDEEVFKSSILNTALLFPFNDTGSELLELLYNTKMYENRNGENKYKVPTFLKNTDYAIVIGKLFKLPK